MSELLTEIWDSANGINFERKQIAVENPLIDERWEFFKYQGHTFNREIFNVVIAGDRVNWQEQKTYWDNDESWEIKKSLKEALAKLQAEGKLSRTIEDDVVAEEAFEDLVSALSAKMVVIEHSAPLEECEFAYYVEPPVDCSNDNCNLSFGGCQCRK